MMSADAPRPEQPTELTPGTAALTLPALERAGRIPIVFHPRYDFGLEHLERQHPFDFGKRGRVFHELRSRLEFNPDSIYTPERASDALLGLVHDSAYLRSLPDPQLASTVMGLPELREASAETIAEGLLEPLRYAVGGTLLAAKLAREHGWAINLSGGFHHAKQSSAEGFCFLADTAVAIKALHLEHPSLRVMSVDLDAHQGNGVADILGADPRVCLFDMYNRDIYPRDPGAAELIDFDFPLPGSIDDAGYMGTLQRNLPQAVDSFRPDLLIYNAGSDIFVGDRLGRMRIAERTIYARDEFVFAEAFQRQIPIVMLLSGGYSKRSPELIAGSIMHVLRRHMGVGMLPRQLTVREAHD